MQTYQIATVGLAILNLLLLYRLWNTRQSRNTTLRISSAATIEEASNLHEQVLIATGDPYFTWDLATDTYEIKQSIRDFGGYRPEELPKTATQFISQIVHPNDRAELTQTIETHFAHETDRVDVEFRILHHDGHWLWVLIRAQTIRDESGKPVQLVGTQTDISRNKEIERDLRNSQRLAGLNDWYLDITTNQLTIVELTKTTGDSPAPQVGPLDQVIHREDLQKVQTAAQHAMDTQEPFELEFRALLTDGETHTFIVYGEAEIDAEMKPLGVGGVFRDVTAERHSESQLLQFGALLEDSVNEVWILRLRDKKFIFANRRASSNSGYSRDELMTLSPTALTDNWSEKLLDKLIKTLGQHEQQWFQRQQQVRRKDGSLYPVDLWCQLTEWNGEKVLATLLIDISDRVEAEQALQRSEEKYRHMFDALPDGVALFQADGTIVDCNEMLAVTHGWQRDDLIGSPISLLTDPAHRSQQSDLVTALAAGQTFLSEGVDVHRDGTQIPFEASARAITIADQPYLITVLHDITERHRYIREVQQRKEEIEQFTYTVSHDLKSPLITIKGFAGLLEQALENGQMESVTSDLQRINNAADKMHHLLEELLEYSRIGSVSLNLTTTPADKIIADALDQVAGQ
ncbi:MAG: hypothetical protein DRQ60_03770, partial [Gammaproteobacteria bacterium]